MTLGDVPLAALRRALERDGLCLRTGPFVASLRTSIEPVADAIATLYADFPLVEPCRFADFHLRLAPLGSWRRPANRQATLVASGYFRSEPFRLAVALPRLEWGLNACIFENAYQYLVVHGATVERGGRAISLLGPSGAGKSTLCAALVLAGWRLLSDELTLIAPRSLDVVPLARPISLKNDSIGLIRRRAPGATFGPVADTLPKGLIAHMRPPLDSVRRMHEPARLSRVFFLGYAPGSTTRWEPLSPAAALTGIARQSGNYGVRGQLGFEHLAHLVDQVPCGRFTYGSLDEAVTLLGRDHFADAA